jgi:hypothetical protein
MVTTRPSHSYLIETLPYTMVVYLLSIEDRALEKRLIDRCRRCRYHESLKILSTANRSTSGSTHTAPHNSAPSSRCVRAFTDNHSRLFPFATVATVSLASANAALKKSHVDVPKILLVFLAQLLSTDSPIGHLLGEREDEQRSTMRHMTHCGAIAADHRLREEHGGDL